MLPGRRKKLRAAISAVLVATASIVIALLVRRASIVLDATVPADGQLGVRYWEVARASFARGDGFPFWDRSIGAGLPFLGNPDTQLLSSLFAGLFGVHGDTMQRWYPTLGAALAVAGTFLWCRRALSVGWLPSLFAGALFAASGFLSLHAAVRMTFVPFALVPWALVLARLGERDLRAACGVGGVLALMLIEGGLYPFCFALVALGVTSAARVPQAGVAAIGRLALVAAAACVLLAGIKLFPVLAQLSRAPRVVRETDAGPLTDLIPMLADRERASMPGRHHHVNEYRGYLGPLAFGMAIAGAGVSLILKPRRVGLVLLLAASVLLTRGVFAEAAPFALLSKVPPFDQLQVPSRFVLLVDLAVAACAAIAVDAAIRAVKKPIPIAVLLVAMVAAVYDPVVAGQKVLRANTTDPRLPRPDPQAGAFHLVPGDDLARAATYPARNVGAPGGQKPWPYPEGSGFAIGAVPQATIDAAEGKVTAVDVAQNAVRVDVVASRPAVLRINQTYDPDFRSSVGVVRRSPKRQLEVELPAGTHRVVVRYVPKGLVPGALATVLGLVGCGLVLVWGTRARRSPAQRPASRPLALRPAA